jgi:hypothetical protein
MLSKIKRKAHEEIYHYDPSKSESQKMKTILRFSVRKPSQVLSYKMI